MTMATTTTLAGSGSITIPTKRHDGASHAEPQGEDQDAFSRYSNDVLRMKALLNFSEDENESDCDDFDLDALAKINDTLRGVGLTGLTSNHNHTRTSTNSPKRRKGNSTLAMPIDDQQRSERKTRLSWELHPCLLMHDMMEELEALENSHYIASDQGCEGLKAMTMLFGGEDAAGEDGPPQLRREQAINNGVATIEDEDEEDDE